MDRCSELLESLNNLSDPKDIVSVYIGIIKEFWAKTEYYDCQKYTLLAIPIAVENDFQEDLIILYRFLGNISYMFGDYSLALENYFKSQKLCELLKKMSELADVVNNIGNVYNALEDFDLSVSYIKKSIEIRKSIGDYNKLHFSFNNLGNSMVEKAKLLDENEKKKLLYDALSVYQEGLNIAQNIDIINYKSFAINNSIGMLYLELKDYEKAFMFFSTVKENCLKNDNKMSLMHAYKGLATYYLLQKKYDLALDNTFSAIDCALVMNTKDKLRNLYQFLSEIYAENDDFKNAYHYHQKYTEMSKIIFSQEFKDKITLLQANFDMETKEREVELYRLKNIELANANREIENQKNELEKVNSFKNEFLGVVVHDLRNPISNVSILCELTENRLQQNNADRPYILKNLSLIRSTSLKMNDMLNELLDFSAIETGKLSLMIKEENYLNFIEEKEFYYQKLAENKKIDFTIDKEYANQTVIADKIRIHEVLDNLISNAIKFTKTNGKVKVSFESKDNLLITHIEDNGQGFYPEELDQLFKNHKRYSATPTDGEKSTGFGLLIVKKIIDLHQTEIWVKSIKNQGSCFSFSLNKS